MNAQSIVVLKFGSSVLRCINDYPAVVHEIYRHVRQGRRVVAVVSAMEGGTRNLLDQANAVSDDPDPHRLAELLGIGEKQSALLLTLALDRAGIAALCVDATDLALTASGDVLEADPQSLDCAAMRRSLTQHSVIVVPGFVALDPAGGSMLLGRGGSDLTALFIAQCLGQVPCRLIKDVDGVYTSDPALASPAAVRYSSLTWAEAAEVADPLVQRKALVFAAEHRLEFEVAGLGLDYATRVGEGPVSLVQAIPSAHRLKVILLGAGTVGYGVYRHLAAHPERFEIVGIAVSDLQKARAPDLPHELLTDNPHELARQPADLVIELIGGAGSALDLMQGALEAGCHVVTANKAVVADSGVGLQNHAASRNAQFGWSATVGGGLPAVELVRGALDKGAVVSVEGVLNGTCNFVLDRLGENVPFEEALAEAQRLGFAEADPSLDLSGRDAASKLRILAHAAYGVEIPHADLECVGIETLSCEALNQQRLEGVATRLVAECSLSAGRFRGQVKPRPLQADDPLAQVHGEWNHIRIRLEDGSQVVVHGKGAGRWPTAESVFADVMDIWRATCPVPVI